MLKRFIKYAYCSGSQPFYTDPTSEENFWDPKMYCNYALQDEYSKIRWEFAFKSRLRTAALTACSMNRNKQTNYYIHLVIY